MTESTHLSRLVSGKDEQLMTVQVNSFPGVIPFLTAPSELTYRIEGAKYKMRVWTDAQWGRLMESEMPPEAVRLGSIGWASMEKVS